MERTISTREAASTWRQILTLSAISFLTVVAWAVLSSISATHNIWMEINIIFFFFSIYLFGYRFAQLFSSRFPAGLSILLGVVSWGLWMLVFGGVGLAFS